MQISRLFGLHQFAVDRFRGHHKAQAQARGQHFGERAHVEHTLGVAGRQRQGGFALKAQVAIGVVLDQRNVQFAGFVHQGLAALLAHGAPRGVLKVGQHIGKAGFVSAAARLGSEIINQHALIVAGHTDSDRLHRGKGLQSAQVGRALNEHTTVFVQKDLADQIQGLLRAADDQHLLRIDIPGQKIGHRLAQRGQSFSGGILQGCRAITLQYGITRSLEGADREGLRGRQAACHADDAGAVGEFENLANG